MFGLLSRDGWQGAGEVEFCGQSLQNLSQSDLLGIRRRDVAFLMQDAQQALDPLVQVGEQIMAATGLCLDESMGTSPGTYLLRRA